MAEEVLVANRRQSAILEAVRRRGSCSIGELASELDVSGETIRRDVRPLARRGLVLRVHGGVVLPERLEEPPFERRMRVAREVKQRIATRVAGLVADGDAIMLDTGSTTAFIGHALVRHSNLVVVTNSVEIARTLATRNGNRVFMAGGELRADDGAAFGPAALDFVAQFRVRHAILSIGAIDLEQGLMDFHPCEVEFSRAVMSQAERVIVAADAGKFGRKGLVKVCGPEGVHVLVTDCPPPPPFAARFHAAGVEVLIAHAGG